MKAPLISYDSRMKIGWDLLMVIAVFASGLIIPYRMASFLTGVDTEFDKRVKDISLERQRSLENKNSSS